MLLPVTLTLQPSRRLVLLLLAAHFGALAITGVITAPAWIKLALPAAILWSAWRSLQGIHGRQRIVRLALRGDGLLDYTRMNGLAGAARVDPHTTVTAQLTVVLLHCDRRIEPLVLLPDSLDAEAYRQLRLWLRWQAKL